MSDKRLTLEEFCRLQGWAYPLPKPGTPEAERWLDEVVPMLDEEKVKRAMKQINQFERSREIRARRGLEDFVVSAIAMGMVVAATVLVLCFVLAVHS